MKKVLLYLLLPFGCFAQYNQMARNAFIQQDIRAGFDFWNIQLPSTKFHSSFQPYLSSTFSEATDSVIPFKIYPFKNYFFSKTLNEKPEKRNWFNLQVHPIVDVEAGFDLLLSKPVITTGGGAHVKLNINDDFTFAATSIGGKNSYPFFTDTSIKNKNIIPESGQSYKKGDGYNYSDHTGYISYSPNNNKIFNFQAGRDKHFIGDGYRSILLSDFAPAYSFFRINTNIWRLQYNVWYTMMNDVTDARSVKAKFRKKYGTFHYLSYNIIKELNIGFFENIIWRGSDSNQVRTFEVNYLNPVIFYRPQEFAIGSPDNSFIGINLNATLMRTLKLYGQLGLDELYLKEIRARRGWWANKQAWQIGAKIINAFGIRGLKLQAEYNQVRPFTYTHGQVDQNYSHYGQPLAHPLGANFRELLGFINYRKNNKEIAIQGMYILTGKDSTDKKSNVGQNIFLSYATRTSDYGHYTGQGIRTVILQSEIRFTWYILPLMNLKFEAGYIQRSEQNARGYALENPYIFVGLKSGIWNKYRDF
jgi:hypothetical protein